MEIIKNNILIKIKNKEEEILEVSIIKNEKILSLNNIKIEKINNNYLIPKIKNYELLNILSSNNKIKKEEELINIKFFQIKYNLKRIIKYNFENNTNFIKFIKIEEIEKLIEKIQYKYKKEELSSKNYIKEIEKLIEEIKIFLNFLIQNNEYTKHIKNKNYIIKNFTKYIVLNENLKQINKINLKKQSIFFTHQTEENKNLLPYNNIYELDKNKKIIMYKYDEEAKIYIISYLSTFTINQQKEIKKHKNNKFYILNRIFQNNIDFNIKNTKFKKIPVINYQIIYLEKMLFELKEEEEDKEVNLREIIEEEIDMEKEITEEKEIHIEETIEEEKEIINQINQDADKIFINQEEFDKEIEEKLFF